MKTCLISTIQFYPDFGGAAIRSLNIAKMLTRIGYNVVVLTVEPSYLRGLKRTERHNVKVFDIMSERTLNNEKNIRIYRLKMIPLQHIRLVDRILRYVYFTVISIIFLILIRKKLRKENIQIDFIYTHFPPLFSYMTGYIFSKLMKMRFLIDVQDLLPEQIETIYKGSLNKFMIPLMYALVRKMYRAADKITLANLVMKKILNKRYEIDMDKMMFLPTGIEQIIHYNKLRARNVLIRKRLMPESFIDKKLIIYTGVMDPPQSLDTIIKAFYNLRQKTSINNIGLILVGEGKMKNKLRRLVHELNLNDIIYIHSYVPRSIALLYICASDIGLVPLKLSKGLKIGLPTKFFDYISCGKPILNISESIELHRLVYRYDIGLSVYPDEDVIYSALLNIAKCSFVNKEQNVLKIQKEFDINNLCNLLKRFLLL
jgi:glycosyltransferase involved in cell wall biosynthesis